MPQKQKLERLDKVIAAQTKLSRRDVQRLVGRRADLCKRRARSKRPT